MVREKIEQYLDLRREDLDVEMFAATRLLQRVRTLIVYGGSEFGRPEQEDSLLPHHLEAFLARAVKTAKKTRCFEQEWRELQQFIQHITWAWEKGQALFQEDLVRATANQEEMEYLPHIDFAVDCYAYVSTHNLYPDRPLLQAWAMNGYMLAWRQHFLAGENTS